MLKRCCCFNLRMGSILIAAIRLISWLFILIGSTYLCWQLFIMGHRGMVQYTVMVNLEENGKLFVWWKLFCLDNNHYDFHVILLQNLFSYFSIRTGTHHSFVTTGSRPWSVTHDRCPTSKQGRIHSCLVLVDWIHGFRKYIDGNIIPDIQHRIHFIWGKLVWRCPLFTGTYCVLLHTRILFGAKTRTSVTCHVNHCTFLSTNFTWTIILRCVFLLSVSSSIPPQSTQWECCWRTSWICQCSL